MPEELTLRTPYLRFAARVWGPPDGLPVLALHGWLDNAASFDRLAPLLPGLRLVALDLPGHGLSDHRPPGIHYHFVDFVADVAAAADALGWDTFSLLGHSMGAGIASLLAGTLPERVVRLALIEGLGPLSARPADNPPALAKAVAQMNQLQDKRLRVFASLEEAGAARQAASDFSLAAAALLTARSLKPTAGGLTWRSDPRLLFKSLLYLTEEQVLAFLTRITAPTVLIGGESGLLVSRPLMRQRYAQVSRLEVKFLPGGHHLHLEDPEPVARILNDFFGCQRTA